MICRIANIEPKVVIQTVAVVTWLRHSMLLVYCSSDTYPAYVFLMQNFHMLKF